MMQKNCDTEKTHQLADRQHHNTTVQNVFTGRCIKSAFGKGSITSNFQVMKDEKLRTNSILNTPIRIHSFFYRIEFNT